MTHQGHRERLRARFAAAPSSLADYEILELLLGYVFARRDTKPLAKALLERFLSLRGVLNARPEDLETVAAIGPASGVFLGLIREFTARVAEEPLRQREKLCSAREVAAMARQRLGPMDHEEIWAAFVDNQNRLLCWEQAARGTINSTALHPRSLMERALALKASGLLLVHNHPGGNASPSSQDLDLTERLKNAADTLGIRFLDHLIVTEADGYSILSNSRV
ncbi:MAG: DNA repair protein RadC [Desulfovibrio sp.]|jgi:DNA repair protein RadC|nr:DNA repair protein RadC [Desulfovibrio sp.]